MVKGMIGSGREASKLIAKGRGLGRILNKEVLGWFAG
jgi:hypothetical protein